MYQAVAHFGLSLLKPVHDHTSDADIYISVLDLNLDSMLDSILHSTSMYPEEEAGGNLKYKINTERATARVLCVCFICDADT